MRAMLLRLILRVPVLHRTVSRRFLLLTGLEAKPVSPPVPVRYAAHEGRLIALGTDRATWWRGLPAEGEVRAEARLKGRMIGMHASLAHGDVLDESILRYLQKYPGEWKALGIDATAEPDDVQTAAHAAAVVLLRPA